MYWEKIEGFFNFDNIYQRMVTNAKNEAIFVEIGTWKGQSAVFMAEAIKRSGKDIKWYVIDTFEGTADEHDKDEDIINRSLYETYLNNISPVKEFITTIKGNSKEVHTQFDDLSLDFLFIDVDHTYKAVRSDLVNWFPKVKKSGIIAGHDYAEPTCGVKMAVDAYFLFTGIQTDRTSWIYKKP
jgi:predicted O-methyltransferase YrrM